MPPPPLRLQRQLPRLPRSAPAAPRDGWGTGTGRARRGRRRGVPALGRGILCLPGAPPAGRGWGCEARGSGDPSAAPASNSAAYRAGEERRARPRPLISAGGGGAGAGPERFHWSSAGPSRPRTRQDPSQKRVSGLLLQPGVSRGNGGGAGLRHLAPPSTPRRNAPPPDSRPLAFPRLRNLMGRMIELAFVP